MDVSASYSPRGEEWRLSAPIMLESLVKVDTASVESVGRSRPWPVSQRCRRYESDNDSAELVGAEFGTTGVGGRSTT